MRSCFKILICCFVIILGASFPAAANAQPGPNQASLQSCAQAVQSFYNWYLPRPNDYKAVNAKPQLFSAQIVQLMKADQAAQMKSQDEVGLDFDPFLNAQNVPRHIVLGAATLRGSTCRVPVFLEFSNAKPAKPGLFAELGVQNGHWIFTNFSYDSGSDLIKTLKSLQAERAKNGSR